MPDTKVVFMRLASSRFFTKLDPNKGYFQMPLEKERQRVTTFSAPWGFFQHEVLPSGLENSSAVFNYALRDVLWDMQGVVVFMDDILVHPVTLEEHLQLLEQVLRCL